MALQGVAIFGVALALLLPALWRSDWIASSPSPRVVAVEVVDRGAGEAEPPAGLRVDTEALAARIEGRWRAAGVLPLALGEPGRPGLDYRLTVELRLRQSMSDSDAATDSGTGSGTLLGAFVSTRLSRIAPSARSHRIVNEAVAERVFDASSPIDLTKARAHLERATDDILDGLVKLVRLWTGSASDRLAALSSDDADVLREAAHAVSERQEIEAVPALVTLLKDGRADVRELALGALLDIGDRRAVKPITEMARLNDAERLPRIIEAVATLGGDEARAYLEFIVSAHEDVALRDQAATALATLEQRDAGAERAAGRPAATAR